MKTIYLLRHARAEKSADDDSKRKLLKSGRQDAEKMAKEFASKAMLPELIISSTAKRALETARIFAKGVGYKKKNIASDKLLFENKQEAYLPVIKALDNRLDSVMMIGHNPSFNEFAASLDKRFKNDIPSCGLVGIKINTTDWKNVAAGKGEVVFYTYPGLREQKRQEYKAYREQLQTRLTTVIRNELKKVNADIAEKVTRSIEKSTEPISKRFVKLMREREVAIPTSRKKTAAKPAGQKTRRTRTRQGRKPASRTPAPKQP